jgi:hypothetical protein
MTVKDTNELLASVSAVLTIVPPGKFRWLFWNVCQNRKPASNGKKRWCHEQNSINSVSCYKLSPIGPCDNVIGQPVWNKPQFVHRMTRIWRL